MTWQQIRTHYPNQWVIMEALNAHTEGDRRVFEDLSVLDSCEANTEIFSRYRQLRARFPQKEIIFFHGSREDLEILVQRSLSPRFRQ